MIRNPKTGRMVKKDGVVGKEVLKSAATTIQKQFRGERNRKLVNLMKAIKLNPKPKTNTTYGQFKELMTMLRIAKNEGNLNSNNYRNAFRKNFESVIETDIENTTENKGSYDTDRNFYKALRAKNVKAIATLWHEIYDKGNCRW